MKKIKDMAKGFAVTLWLTFSMIILLPYLLLIPLKPFIPERLCKYITKPLDWVAAKNEELFGIAIIRI